MSKCLAKWVLARFPKINGYAEIICALTVNYYLIQNKKSPFNRAFFITLRLSDSMFPPEMPPFLLHF